MTASLGLSVPLLVAGVVVSSPTAGAAQEYTVAQVGDAKIAAPCASELTPDRVVMSGAMTADGIKPLEIRARLDKQLEALRAAADRLGARIAVGERLRAARSRSDSPRDSAPLLFVPGLPAHGVRTMVRGAGRGRALRHSAGIAGASSADAIADARY